MPSNLNATDSINIFISYAYQDEKLEQQLYKHLRPLVRNGVIRTWDARQIQAGTERNEELIENFNQADIILCLISPDFIDSDYCYLFQGQTALQRQKEGKVRVIPILLRSAAWKSTIFGTFQIIPRNGDPIAIQRSRDHIFAEIADEIAIVAKNFHRKTL